MSMFSGTMRYDNAGLNRIRQQEIAGNQSMFRQQRRNKAQAMGQGTMMGMNRQPMQAPMPMQPQMKVNPAIGNMQPMGQAPIQRPMQPLGGMQPMQKPMGTPMAQINPNMLARRGGLR